MQKALIYTQEAYKCPYTMKHAQVYSHLVKAGSQLLSFELKEELHSKLILKCKKWGMQTNFSSILLFQIDPPVKRK